MKILPFALDYWNKVADEIFVLDNGSTDGSAEYLKDKPNVHIVNFNSDGFNDKIHKDLKNQCWKKCKGRNVDYVIVCDLDEFMYAKDGLRETLAKYKEKGITIFQPIGYNMMCETFPEYQDGKYLWDIVTKGFRDNHFNKCTIFDPNAIDEINYQAGAHACSPRGKIVRPELSMPKIYLLHFKYIGLDYVINRYDEYNRRLSKLNREKHYGIQYTQSKQQITKRFEKDWGNCKNIMEEINN